MAARTRFEDRAEAVHAAELADDEFGLIGLERRHLGLVHLELEGLLVLLELALKRKGRLLEWRIGVSKVLWHLNLINQVLFPHLYHLALITMNVLVTGSSTRAYFLIEALHFHFNLVGRHLK